MRMLNHTKQAAASTLVLTQNDIYQGSRGRCPGFRTPFGELLRGLNRIKWLVILLLLLNKPLACQDKALHASAGVVLTWGGATAFRNPSIGLALGVSGGIAKEVLDSWARGNRFDKNDFLATLAGSVLTYVALRLALASEQGEEDTDP
ncbi:MAG TPA: hypothetical protein VFS51_00120 [Gemmatimonadales bacterium]|nr:hypothetical protein [Gemmatimonadales bacterium]